MILSPEQIRHQRRTALLCALLVAPFALLDVRQAGSPAALAALLAARGVWVLSLLVGAALLRPARAPRPTAAAAVMSTTTTAAVLVIVAVTGGPGSGYFSFLLLMPLCMQVLLPGQLLVATASGAAGIVGGAVMLAGAGTSPLDLTRWVGTGVAGGAIAAYASHVGGALFRRELAAAAARAEASAALALSERRRAATERLALVGRLAAGVAHEVNNPLAFVKANLAFVGDALAAPGARLPARAEAREAIGEALLGVDRIGRIVADLRGFARDEAGEPCGADAAQAIDEALRLASVRTRGVLLRVCLEAGLPPLGICRQRLVQVLLNLVVNAAEAVQATGDERRRWITVEAARHEGGVSIAVEDGGDGLDEAALARLFEPFFTTKPPGAGTGLGLAVSHEYVSAAGGRLTGGNGERGGARFEIQLPVHAGGAAGGAPCPHDEPLRAAHG